MTSNLENSNKKNKAHLKGKKIIGMQVATILEKSGSDFWDWIEEIENKEIFQLLHQPTSNTKIIRINPIHNYYITSKNYRKLQQGPSGVRAIFKSYPALYKLFINLGWRKFSYYFIENKGSFAERNEQLKVSYKEAKDIEKIILHLFENAGIFKSKLNSTGFAFLSGEHEEVIARIMVKDGKIHTSYTYPLSRYTVDEEKSYLLITEGLINQKQIKQFYSLRQNLENINLRFNLLYQITQLALNKQNKYICSGKVNDLVILEGKDVAKKLEIDPSWVCRLIKSKNLLLNEEILRLRNLFISKKNLHKKKGSFLIKKLINRQNQRILCNKINRPYSDEELRIQLLCEFDFKVSRRTLNNWKREVERENGYATNEHMGKSR